MYRFMHCVRKRVSGYYYSLVAERAREKVCVWLVMEKGRGRDKKKDGVMEGENKR